MLIIMTGILVYDPCIGSYGEPILTLETPLADNL